MVQAFSDVTNMHVSVVTPKISGKNSQKFCGKLLRIEKYGQEQERDD